MKVKDLKELLSNSHNDLEVKIIIPEDSSYDISAVLPGERMDMNDEPIERLLLIVIYNKEKI